MRIYFFLLSLLSLASCRISENIKINNDGTGFIETETIRDESTFLKIRGDDYFKEEEYQDTTYLFKDNFKLYSENFSKITAAEKAILVKQKDVKVNIKKDSYNKEYVTKVNLQFNKIEDVPDLYKTQSYTNDLKNNYSLFNQYYFDISYTFDGTVFRRIIKITNKDIHDGKTEEVDNSLQMLDKFKINQPYELKYSFPRRIKSVSNKSAIISDDKNSVKLIFLLTDCIKNPAITNLEVVLEK